MSSESTINNLSFSLAMQIPIVLAVFMFGCTASLLQQQKAQQRLALELKMSPVSEPKVNAPVLLVVIKNIGTRCVRVVRHFGWIETREIFQGITLEIEELGSGRKVPFPPIGDFCPFETSRGDWLAPGSHTVLRIDLGRLHVVVDGRIWGHSEYELQYDLVPGFYRVRARYYGRNGGLYCPFFDGTIESNWLLFEVTPRLRGD